MSTFRKPSGPCHDLATRTWPHLPRKRRQPGATQAATLPELNVTMEKTEWYSTDHAIVDPYSRGTAKSEQSARSRMRAQNASRVMPDDAKAFANDAVCWHLVLREEAERKSAFCVPVKHEHSNPSRQETQTMAVSRLVVPDRKTIARERDILSPMTTAVTGEGVFSRGRDVGRPHARFMQVRSATCT